MAGYVLIAAALAGVVAASVPPGRIWMSARTEYLRIVGENEWRWRASAWAFAVSTVLVAVGLLMVVLMVGGQAAVALLGASFIADPRVPQWAAWTACILGAVEAGSFSVGWPRAVFGTRSIFELPVLVPLVPWFIATPFAASAPITLF